MYVRVAGGVRGEAVAPWLAHGGADVEGPDSEEKGRSDEEGEEEEGDLLAGSVDRQKVHRGLGVGVGCG